MWAPKLRNGVHSRSRMEQTGMNLSVCGTGNGAIAPVPSPGSRCTVNYSPRSLQSTCRRNIRVIAAVACELADTIIYFGDAVVAQWFILPILNTNAFLKAKSLQFGNYRQKQLDGSTSAIDCTQPFSFLAKAMWERNCELCLISWHVDKTSAARIVAITYANDWKIETWFYLKILS